VGVRKGKRSRDDAVPFRVKILISGEDARRIHHDDSCFPAKHDV
jgi:hypothetical protein